ncbi:hypothetical protein [Actinomyces sp. ZJ308]|uniref:hypothetical protein n=1 Tax=Actinomyces sp. ZJ308 TaxID=2708342 RepID=UPI001423D682|nr:hypothetical protein [Actinomyces sp. ZJ308]
MSGTRANLQVGEMLQGGAGNLSVRGCLLFKEWDAQDRCFYYWEEWQLIGASSADTWVELDHDPGEVLFYEPVHLQETIEPWALAVGQQLQLTINGTVHHALVEEVTTGTLEEVIGSPVCPLNIGETMTYVELRVTDPAGVTSRLTIDSHRFRDLLAYRKTTLSTAQQRQLFGRVIYSRSPVGSGAGRNIGCALIGAIVSVVLVVGLFSSCSSSARSGGSADSTSTSDTGSSRTYRHRPVYGGGGGGVGK